MALRCCSARTVGCIAFRRGPELLQRGFVGEQEDLAAIEHAVCSLAIHQLPLFAVLDRDRSPTGPERTCQSSSRNRCCASGTDEQVQASAMVGSPLRIALDPFLLFHERHGAVAVQANGGCRVGRGRRRWLLGAGRWTQRRGPMPGTGCRGRPSRSSCRRVADRAAGALAGGGLPPRRRRLGRCSETDWPHHSAEHWARRRPAAGIRHRRARCRTRAVRQSVAVRPWRSGTTH